jgi:catechol 2,3-dioxygenase-like lactoylglutathione lyase family enzyme
LSRTSQSNDNFVQSIEVRNASLSFRLASRRAGRIVAKYFQVRSFFMIDHLGFPVSDLERSKAFYSAAFAPLGIALLAEVTAEQSGGGAHAGYGANGKAFFWIGDGRKPQSATHVAFAAPSRAIVDAFHEAALKAGGRDNGAPGLRPHYHENFYGAFVFDPDGNNIEAVCHSAP